MAGDSNMPIGFLHSLRPLFWFQANADGGAGAGPGDPPSGDPPADPPADDGKGQGKDPPTDGDPAEDDKVVSHKQAELNKLFGNARDAGRKTEQKAILDKAGFKSMKELTDAIEALRKSEDAKKSAIDLANEKAANAETARAAAENEAKELKLQRRFEAGVTALDLEFVNDKASEDAFEILKKIEIGDEKDAMPAAIKQLAKERPYLFGTVEHKENDSKEKGKGPQNNQIPDERKKGLRQRFRLPGA
jgi:hypothetical protein